MNVASQTTRTTRFEIRVSRNTQPGRYIIGGEVTLNDRLIGEAAVALVDVI